jgi:hypothetical protein
VEASRVDFASQRRSHPGTEVDMEEPWYGYSHAMWMVGQTLDEFDGWLRGIAVNVRSIGWVIPVELVFGS